MRAIGLDIGSTSIKAAVLEPSGGGVLEERSIRFPAAIPNEDRQIVEVDPRQILSAIEQALEGLWALASDPCHLLICGQMGGLILADPKGRPRSNYLSWRDCRSLKPLSPSSESWLERLRGKWSEDVWNQLGRELQPGSTTTLLAWLQHHGQCPSDAIPLTLPDFLVSYLLEQPGLLHSTMAIGIIDPRIHQWHREAMQQIGIAECNLPTIIDQTSSLGETTHRGRRLRIHGGFGDQPCALLGAGLQPHQLSINCSTGAQVSRRSDRFIPGPYQSRRFFFGDWLQTITHLPAGRALNGWVDLLQELAGAEGITLQSPWQSIADALLHHDANGLQAELALHRSPFAETGSLTHITLENLSVGSLMAACCDSMVSHYHRAAAALDPQHAAKEILLTGGLAERLPGLNHRIASRFQLPLRQVPGESTLQGLLHLVSLPDTVATRN
jgi:sugar (pentulose or hexulose) kinase